MAYYISEGFYHHLFFIWQLGIGIRAIEQGHLPPINFMLVAMGNTLALLIGWRTLVSIIFSGEKTNKNEDYRRGSPFELFEVCFPLLYVSSFMDFEANELFSMSF